jgi:cyclophilin family peptidyl-prolyl cis-trans isomerase
MRNPTVVAVIAGALLSHAASAYGQTRPEGLYARIHTTKGLIVAKLEPDQTPLAVTNFVGLAEGAIENAAFDAGRPFYDGTVWHRVAPGHVIQTGIPDSDRANGPGYVFPNQIHADLSHDHAGALNMANGGPGTNASQWCITLGDRSYLDGDYIVFGEVVEGMDVVLSIVQGDGIDSVRIERVGARAEAFLPDSPGFRAMVRAAEARALAHERLNREAKAAWLERSYPGATGDPGGVRTKVLSPGSAEPSAQGPRRIRYTGTSARYIGHLRGHEGPPLELVAFGSGADGLPGFHQPPREFTFTPGSTSINAGLDAAIARMAPGEVRVVVVPAELGYGRDGLYTPETPAEPRFVISPNTLLAYVVEVLPSTETR